MQMRTREVSQLLNIREDSIRKMVLEDLVEPRPEMTTGHYNFDYEDVIKLNLAQKLMSEFKTTRKKVKEIIDDVDPKEILQYAKTLYYGDKTPELVLPTDNFTIRINICELFDFAKKERKCMIVN